MREALFSSLGEEVAGAQVLDLFAGSGAYGLESLSRGAERVVFVEQNKRTVASLRQNLAAVTKSMGAGEAGAVVITADVFHWAPRPSEKFDLVLADPPYDQMGRAAARVAQLAAAALQTVAEARLCLEMPGEFEPRLPGFTLIRRIGKGRDQPTMGIFARILSGSVA